MIRALRFIRPLRRRIVAFSSIAGLPLPSFRAGAMRRTLMVALAVASLTVSVVQAADDRPSSSDEVSAVKAAQTAGTQLADWVAGRESLDAEAKASALAAAQRLPSSNDPLADVMAAFCLVDPVSAAAWKSLEDDQAAVDAAQLQPWRRTELGTFYSANASLAAARRLVERRLFDEALEMLSQVEPRDTVDPALAHFLKAAAARALLKYDDAAKAAAALLSESPAAARRYRALAELLKSDVEQVKEQPLHMVAGLMSDSERRLDLGRSGEPVQSVQDRIIATLDELIKKLEAQQGGGGGGGGQSNNPGGSPADDSRVKGAVAPGETDPKRFSKSDPWGNLPDKEQTRAKNIVNRNFPPHYSDAIEKYSRKLANRAADAPP